jgi:hypothetical protein
VPEPSLVRGVARTSCTQYHDRFGRFANGELQTGELPAEFRVQGRVVWYVYRGPYDEMGVAWGRFMGKVRSAHLAAAAGPPGDIYVCDPNEHKEDAGAGLLTLFWAPLPS